MIWGLAYLAGAGLTYLWASNAAAVHEGDEIAYAVVWPVVLPLLVLGLTP